MPWGQAEAASSKTAASKSHFELFVNGFIRISVFARRLSG
jgi:hypothetical protein